MEPRAPFQLATDEFFINVSVCAGGHGFKTCLYTMWQCLGTYSGDTMWAFKQNNKTLSCTVLVYGHCSDTV